MLLSRRTWFCFPLLASLCLLASSMEEISSTTEDNTNMQCIMLNCPCSWDTTTVESITVQPDGRNRSSNNPCSPFSLNLSSHRNKLIRKIDALHSTKCSDRKLAELKESLNEFFNKIDSCVEERKSTQTQIQAETRNGVPVKIGYLSNLKPKEPKIEVPKPKCDNGMDCMSRWQCSEQKKIRANTRINIKEQDVCHYLETCCNGSFLNISLITSGDFRCGFSKPKGHFITIVGNEEGEAHFGEYPWTVGVFSESHKYLFGGSLISTYVVLTTARQSNINEKYTVRAGEWDMETDKEPLPYQERSASLIIHPDFSKSNLRNDIALLILDAAFHKMKHTVEICLPPQGDFNYANCLVAGWNRYPQKGRSILKSMPLSVRPCADGTDDHFLCVTGQKDDLTFAFGSALVCSKIDGINNQYYQVGVWSYGTGTNNTKFTNVIKYMDWIKPIINEIEQKKNKNNNI